MADQDRPTGTGVREPYEPTRPPSASPKGTDMTTTTLDLYHPDSHQGFLADTDGHVMQVLHDDRLYRHLFFNAPGNSLYWYEIVTWPGALTVRGGMGTFTFSRTEDMFEFFTGGYINPGYWAEKIPSESRDAAHRHDEGSVTRRVTSYWNEHKDGFSTEQQETIWADIDMEILGATASDAIATHHALTNFNTEGFEFQNVWEWDFKDWSAQYLWSCHAIMAGIRQYKAAHQ